MNPHACHNRPPLAISVRVPDGWTTDGRRKWATRPDPMSKNCVYGRDNPDDLRCAGCRWQTKEHVK